MRTARLKRLWGLLAAVMVVAAACGGDDQAAGPGTTAAGGGAAAQEKTVGLVYDIGGRGDKSFNDSAARGLDKAKGEFKFKVKELEPSSGGENREELLRLLAQEKYQLIYAVGFLFADHVEKVAPSFPDTRYALVDGSVDKPNVASLLFAEEQGSFLVGAAAALKSRSGRVGFIGGVDTDLIKKFEAGYVAGARQVNPSIQVDVKYISQPPDFSGFNDPSKGKEIAKGMYCGGADVVYHAAGGSGKGLFAATVEAGPGKWAIGVDSDQYQTATEAEKKQILTSMLKQVDVAVYDTAKAFNSGEFKAGKQTFDLKSGGIDYSTSGGHVDDIKSRLEDFKSQIVSGKISVPTKP